MSGAIRAVVFDLGGVLIDLWNGPALSAVAGVVGVSKPEIATVYRSLEEPISTGALSVADALERLLQTAGGDRFPEPRRGRAVRLIQATLGNRFTPNGPVIELSYALASRGVTVAVGSNTNPLDIAALRRQFPDLFVPFEGRVFASHEIGAMKPARAFYAAVSAGLKLDPGVCVFIDDRGENVAAARQFGMHAIRYTGTDELTEELADLIGVPPGGLSADVYGPAPANGAVPAAAPAVRSDRRSADAMWRDFRDAGGGEGVREEDVIVDHFGDSPALATELASLILHGPKRATATSLPAAQAGNQPLPYPGLYTIVVDGSGAACCILKTTAVSIVPFEEVGEEFAAMEGEDDRTLASWRREHETYFTRELVDLDRHFTPRMPVICETFDLVWPAGPGLLAPAES